MATVQSINMGEVNGVKEEKGSWGGPDASYQEVSEDSAYLSACVGDWVKLHRILSVLSSRSRERYSHSTWKDPLIASTSP